MENNGAIVTGVLCVVAITVAVVFFLARGITDGQPLAYSIAILLWTGIVFAAGVGFTLAVQQIGENRGARRARQEQERFRDNIQENVAMMGAVVKVQTEQTRAQSTHNAMLMRQASAATRLLPSGNGEGEAAGFPFDEADFMDLED